MAPTPLTQYSTPTGFKAIYYHTEWSIYARNYFVKSLPIDNLVDIAYAFLNVNADGTVNIIDPWAAGGAGANPFINAGQGVDPQNTWSSPAEDLGNFGQFKKLLKDQTSIGLPNKEFNLMISIGGWSNSVHFSEAFSTEERRTTFVTSLSQFLTDFPIFNGVSIDWEYVSDNGVNYGLAGNSVSVDDGENFVLLLQKLRDALPGYTLASCCNAAPEKNHWPIKRAVDLLDELHVMTYDFHDGNWGETTTAHHTNLRKSSAGTWSAEEGVDFFLAEGVPASKIFIGGALYSRGFANTTGINSSASGGSLHKSWEDGVVDYKALPWSGSTEMWDDEAKAAYAYDATAKNVDTYDNVTSIVEKAKYVKEKGLGGIILWETSGDVTYDNTNNRSIMKALHDNLTHG